VQVVEWWCESWDVHNESLEGFIHLWKIFGIKKSSRTGIEYFLLACAFKTVQLTNNCQFYYNTHTFLRFYCLYIYHVAYGLITQLLQL